ncbi:FG-GAP repeat domain-containing protein [Rhodanobacter sp. Col0626]|uniref:FG-GAP repeat domain-containing protein n=1 Tax=Rhodanobacter sp. Col0626 TaxID=3415679 RepID=UPI003CF8FE94
MCRIDHFALLYGFALLLGATRADAQDVRIDTSQVLQATTPVPGSSRVPGDFNGDGISDLLWVNPLTNQISYWLMASDSSGIVTVVGSKGFNVIRGYFPGAVGDFNGDGLADIVFTSSKHDLYLWSNDGHGQFHSSLIGTYPKGWQLLGAGDIDGDSQDDLLWFNASSCQFSYWLIKQNALVGSGAKSVVCGDTPLSIGYYTPSNRLSIVWTTPQRTFYAWDGQVGEPAIFATSRLGAYETDPHITLRAFGGGYAGANMGWVVWQHDVDAYGNQLYAGHGQVLNRAFDVNGQQMGVSGRDTWSGGYAVPLSSAGFLINVRGTGVIYQYGNSRLEICPPTNSLVPGPAASAIVIDNGCTRFTYPRGWFVVGAMANGVAREVTP